MPKLVGKKLVSAKEAIVKGHCRVGKVSHVKSTKKQKGRVVRARPAPGRHLKKGAPVDLWIGP